MSCSWRPRLEPLEDRSVPAVHTFANLSEFGPLTVRSGGGNDVLAASLQKVRTATREFVIDRGAGNDQVRVASPSGAFLKPIDRFGDVKNLDNAPGGGDSNWIDLNAPAVPTVDFPVLIGAGHGDVFVGLFGLSAARGKVTVLTADGNDRDITMQKVRGDVAPIAATGAGDDTDDRRSI